MLLCVVGINVCFGWWSVKQERAITKPYFVADADFAASVAALSARSARRAAAAKASAPLDRPHPVYLSTVYGICLTQTLAGAFVSGSILCAQAVQRRVRERRAQALRHAKKNRRAAKPRAATTATARTSAKQSEEAQRTVLTRRDVSEMLALGFSNIFGTSLGYAAMRRLSYPVALTAKMCKMLPVMFVGFCWYGTRYSTRKMASCLLITGGVIAFFVLENRINATGAVGTNGTASTNTTSAVGKSGGGAPAKHAGGGAPSSFLGMTLLLLNLLMDGYTNSTQDVLVKRHRWSGAPLMMWTNLVSSICAVCVLLMLEFGEELWYWLVSMARDAVAAALRSPSASHAGLVASALQWISSVVPAAPRTAAAAATSATAAVGVRESLVPFHDLSHFIAFLTHCPEARHDVLLLSLLNALGQLFIFHTISVFGTLALTAMTLLRKAGSVILSIVVHGHPVQGGQWASLGAVFVGVLGEGYVNIQEASLRQGRATAAAKKAVPSSSASASTSPSPTPAPQGAPRTSAVGKNGEEEGGGQLTKRVAGVTSIRDATAAAQPNLALTAAAAGADGREAAAPAAALPGLRARRGR